jgi:HNH endonuclease
MTTNKTSQKNENGVESVEDVVYVFDLKMLCGGYAYFSTFTSWSGFGKSRREIRQPGLVYAESFFNLLKGLGYFSNKSFLHSSLMVGDQSQYESWLYRKGWGFVTKEFVQTHMSQWLKPRECLRSPLRIFTDIEIVPPATLKQHAHSRLRGKVLERDGEKCLICETETQLTMQHVTPYSYGGETTLRNLVTLCNDCNQKCGVELLTELYDLAGLHHSFDPSLVKKVPTQELIYRAVSLSDNLMQTRCEVW